MAKFSISVGELRTPIWIAHKENIVEDDIITGEEYIKDFKLYSKANKEQIYKEENDGYQENYVEIVTFTVRYTDKVTYDNVVIFQDRPYRIVDLDNILFGDKWLKIRCKAIQNDIEQVVQWKSE